VTEWEVAFRSLALGIANAERVWTKLAAQGGAFVDGVTVTVGEANVAAGACEALVALSARLASAIETRPIVEEIAA